MESITSHIKNTIYVGVERKMIAKKIETANVDSSNVFLRKLWGAIASASQFGWQYMPYTDKRQKIVDIGRNNLGHFYFTHKKRGTIDTLYVDECRKEDLVESLIDKALMFQEEKEYAVEMYFDVKTYPLIATSHYNNISVKSEEKKVVFCIPIKAYSSLDLEYIAYQRALSLSSLLFVYTHINYGMPSITLLNEMEAGNKPTTDSDYNYEWYDADECPQSERGEIVLPKEFLMLIEQITENFFLDDFTTSIVNASQLIYNSINLYDASRNLKNMPMQGLYDIINTVVISSLEALASTNKIESKKCPCCGQEVYSVVQNVYSIAEKYLDEPIASDIKNRIYRNRSKYLHEGKSSGGLYRYKWSYPLIKPHINPNDKNFMILGYGAPEYNLIDYCMYITRMIVCDYYNHL